MNDQEKNILKQKILNDFLNKINISESYEMISEDLKNEFIKNKLIKIIDELFELSNIKVSYLSERDTYIFRKLYGIFDNGVYQIAQKIGQELNVSNVGSIRSRYFARMTTDFKKQLDDFNFEKKKDAFIKFFGFDSKWLMRFNAIVFDEIPDYFRCIDLYLRRNSLDEAININKDVKFKIKSIDELENIELTENELEILKLRHGLNDDSNRPLLIDEVADIYGISKDRVRTIEKLAIHKINSSLYYYVPNIPKSVYEIRLNGNTSIHELNLDYRISYHLTRHSKIYTIEQLLEHSEEDLKKHKYLGPRDIILINTCLDIVRLTNGIEINLSHIEKSEELALYKELIQLEQQKEELLKDAGNLDVEILNLSKRLGISKSGDINEQFKK